MAFIPVPDTVSVEVRMLMDQQKIENTLAFRLVGGWDLTSAAALGADLLLWWTNDYRVQISNEVSLREIFITDLSSATGFTHSQPAPAPNPTGSQNLPSSPNNVALCLSFRTVNRGRSYRGRNYISGIPRDNVTSNDVSPGAVGGLLAAYNALFTLASSNGADWVVVSRYANKLPRVTGVATNITSVVVVDPTVDSQRRRLPGRGS